MSEVIYSINGKYFKDFSIYVSDSDGLFDALKRKKVNSYDWAEYHGSAPDLSSPKFEEREISLKCFVVGENWEVMKSNFYAIISEFQKAGTQRLLIEPFGLKALPYEVAMVDEVSLKKTFREGKTVGTFTLKLIEPNPIKKVLYLTGETLNLSYNSPNETEIFYGNGLKDVVKGNASLAGKDLANRVVSGYGFEGRNLIRNSKGHFTGRTDAYGGINKEPDDIYFHLTQKLVQGESYVLTLKRNAELATIRSLTLRDANGNTEQSVVPDSEGKFVFIAESNSIVKLYFYSLWINSFWDIWELKLEKGNKATDWSPAPEEQKYIIIAGNIEEITDLTTNADKILWERL